MIDENSAPKIVILLSFMPGGGYVCHVEKSGTKRIIVVSMRIVLNIYVKLQIVLKCLSQVSVSDFGSVDSMASGKNAEKVAGV